MHRGRWLSIWVRQCHSSFQNIVISSKRSAFNIGNSGNKFWFFCCYTISKCVWSCRFYFVDGCWWIDVLGRYRRTQKTITTYFLYGFCKGIEENKNNKVHIRIVWLQTINNVNVTKLHIKIKINKDCFYFSFKHMRIE